jgi:hypothetical protein
MNVVLPAPEEPRTMATIGGVAMQRLGRFENVCSIFGDARTLFSSVLQMILE